MFLLDSNEFRVSLRIVIIVHYLSENVFVLNFLTHVIDASKPEWYFNG